MCVCMCVCVCGWGGGNAHENHQFTSEQFLTAELTQPAYTLKHAHHYSTMSEDIT